MTPTAAKLHKAADAINPELASPLDVTVFVSCYNESQYIANTLDNVREALCEIGTLTYEIIIIDDCSSDDSARVISEYLNRYPTERILFRRNLVNLGWAHNYVDAAFLGCGKYFRVVCGDESEPKETMVRVFRHLGEADILVPYYATTQGRSIYRRTLSRAYTALVNLLSGLHLSYYNGLHVHLRYNVMRWHSNTRGFGFQADLLCQLLGRGFSYKEIPVTTVERKKGNSTALSFRNFLSVGHTLFDILARRLANWTYKKGTSVPASTGGIWPERHWKGLALALAILTATGFYGWAWSLESAIEHPGPGTIDVTSASFGQNCGAAKDNVLDWVRSSCDGKRQCSFRFDSMLLGNPAPTCAKEFLIQWRCSAGGRTFEKLRPPPEPAQNELVPLDCAGEGRSVPGTERPAK